MTLFTTTIIEQKHLMVESKRSSLSTYVRYASKLIKSKADIRNHRTLPDIDTAVNEKNYFYGDDYTRYTEDNVKILKECYHQSRRESQLALPPRLTYAVNATPLNVLREINQAKDEEEDLDEQENDQENQLLHQDHPHSFTLRKLYGISFENKHKPNNKPSTAILITLSPCALAAANAARQKRRQIRVSH